MNLRVYHEWIHVARLTAPSSPIRNRFHVRDTGTPQMHKLYRETDLLLTASPRKVKNADIFNHIPL